MFLRDAVIAGISSAILFTTLNFVVPAQAEGDPQAVVRALQERRAMQPTGSVEKSRTAKAKDEKRTAMARNQKPAQPEVLQRAQPAVKVSVLPTVDVAAEGNNGELRSSDLPVRNGGFFKTIFGEDQPPRFLPETQTLDSVLAARSEKSRFSVKPEFVPQSVAFSGYDKGTIVIDTTTRYLYLVEGRDSARRYAIAVGKEGLAFKGSTTVGDKQEWPRWFPTKEMQEREPKKYGPYKDGMNGGPENPLGARAIYLYQGKLDTHIRIHGTNQPQSIGSAASNGCFRMINDHVIDLYNRVKVGTQVVVL